MKRLFVFLFVVVCTIARGQNESDASKKFPITECRQDLDSMYLQMQLNHPSLFAHFAKPDADKSFYQLRNSIAKSLSRQELTRLLFPFVAKFRDGHCFVSVEFDSGDFLEYAKAGKFFPLTVFIQDGHLYADNTQSANTALERGDEILTVNGVASKILIDRLKNMWAADGEANALATTQRLFSYSLWLAFGWGNETKVSFRKGNKPAEETLQGIAKDELLQQMFPSGGARQMHLYPEYNLAVVEINSYNYLSKAVDFIDSCFRVIKQQNIRNVALDLRRNGGGNSYIGDYFLAHVTRKSYNTIRQKQWRLGPLVNSLPKDHWMYASIDSDRKTYTVKGEFLQSAEFAPQEPTALKDSSLFADVAFFLFTSPRTYSSAHMTALAVKCGGLGTIIGEATGERLDLTGEILEYKLPNSGIVIVIPTAAYKTACGDGEQVGVQPDYLVQPDIESIRLGRDNALEKLKEIIAQKHGGMNPH